MHKCIYILVGFTRPSVCRNPSTKFPESKVLLWSSSDIPSAVSKEDYPKLKRVYYHGGLSSNHKDQIERLFGLLVSKKVQSVASLEELLEKDSKKLALKVCDCLAEQVLKSASIDPPKLIYAVTKSGKSHWGHTVTRYNKHHGRYY